MFRGVAFVWDEESEECCIMTDVEKGSDGALTYKEQISEDNPIIALNMFFARVHEILGREVADKLESQGRNRYTGEVIEYNDE